MPNSEQKGIRAFLSFRFGVVLLGFLAIVGVLLIFERRAHIPGDDWLLIGLLAACLLMHGFMHGGHGRQPPEN